MSISWSYTDSESVPYNQQQSTRLLKLSQCKQHAQDCCPNQVSNRELQSQAGTFSYCYTGTAHSAIFSRIFGTVAPPGAEFVA